MGDIAPGNAMPWNRRAMVSPSANVEGTYSYECKQRCGTVP